jgi:hypothetical protein
VADESLYTRHVSPERGLPACVRNHIHTIFDLVNFKCFSRVTRPGREADHSSSTNADVKDGGAVPPLPMRLQGVLFN